MKAVAPDGTGERTVAVAPGGSITSVAVSPDGRQVVYPDYRFDGRRYFARIWIKDTTGSDTGPGRSLFAGALRWTVNEVAFSADGMRLLYTYSPRGFDDAEIFSVRLDGTGRRRLTNNKAQDRSPVASPGGGWIAFKRAGDIFRMRTDGSRQQRLTSGRAGDGGPDYHPEFGRSIVFSRSLPGRTGPGRVRIFVMDQRGHGERQLPLAGDSTSLIQPAFSPAGDMIAGIGFCGECTPEQWGDLFVSSLGGPLDWVSDWPPGNTGPAWGVRPGTAP